MKGGDGDYQPQPGAKAWRASWGRRRRRRVWAAEAEQGPSWQAGQKVEAFAAEQRGAEMGRRCHRHPEGQTGSWSPFLGLGCRNRQMYLMPESLTEIVEL